MKNPEILKKYRVALSAGALFIVFAGIALFRSGTADELRAELIERESQATKLAENLHNAQRLPAQLEQIDSLSKRIADRLLNPTDVASNQQYFYKLEADSGVKLTELHQTSLGAKSAKVKYTQYSTVIYAANVQGDFAHEMSFLRNLESGSHLAAITSATIGFPPSKLSEDPGPGAALQMNLNIQFLCTP